MQNMVCLEWLDVLMEATLKYLYLRNRRSIYIIAVNIIILLMYKW